MKNNLIEIEERLPKQCCSFCNHLSLDGPSEDYKYKIKCVIFNSLPKSQDRCEYFDPEYTELNANDLDNMYINFLEACIRVKYEDYLKSIHWQLFKQVALLNSNNTCSVCSSSENLDVYHIKPNLGRETLEDVTVLCSKCTSRF